MKLKELFRNQYNELKKEYLEICDRLPAIEKEEIAEETRLKEKYDYCDITFNRNFCASKLISLGNEKKQKRQEKTNLLNKLNKINEILNNDVHVISLKRTELKNFSKGKIILEVGTSAIGNSKSNIKGYLNGGLDGRSFLGFGNIDGSISGSIKGNSNVHYEEYILVKYKYNLDYEIEEFLFNIDDYLESEVN